MTLCWLVFGLRVCFSRIKRQILDLAHARVCGLFCLHSCE
ncbi:hypothetical protein CAMRE0001_3229 [Campylobacter rectus RM3267]|uniref:Uncharacterized protein n=1 Tax=Campylobacter rectus RM3267 TaxID=553218 RepID=B9D4Y7_CAMRE|nr:hypothetical protein CAMRE0001_3229 [Campylobacter rectus RM3267]